MSSQAANHTFTIYRVDMSPDNSQWMEGADRQTGKNYIGLYFRRLRIKLILGMLIAFAVPYGILTIFFHFQFTRVLNETGKLHLISLSESQRKTVDLFLQERVINLFSLFHASSFSTAPSESQMEAFLFGLKRLNNTFVDLGFLNDQGRQVGYAGPHTNLYNKDYSREDWFKKILGDDVEYYITDIYLGFRGKPHFAIAVKQPIGGIPFIIRTTLEPDQLYEFLQTINRTQGVESYLINSRGEYQAVGPGIGKPLQKSEYIPDSRKPSDIIEVKKDGDTIRMAYSWLKETNWILMVRQPLGIAYEKVHQTRRIITTVLVLVLLVFACVIVFTTNKLIHYAWDASEKRDDMRLQLVHATKLASIGELSVGIAQEINNPLAIITATSGVIRDMFTREYNIKWTEKEMLEELDVLNQAVFRIKSITGKLLDFGRKNEPHLIYRNINHVINDVVNGLVEREFKAIDITFVRDYGENIPKIPIDADQFSQVLLNLINNGLDAIEGPGKITLTTRYVENAVKVIVTDTGKGMSIDQLKQIFNPLYTTKPLGKGTGLGLGISLNIIESMGGTIDVQSMEGQGSSFMITLPVSNNKGEVRI